MHLLLHTCTMYIQPDNLNHLHISFARGNGSQYGHRRRDSNFTSSNNNKKYTTSIYLTNNLLLHLTCIALIETAPINCVSFTLSLTHFKLALQLPLCTLS